MVDRLLQVPFLASIDPIWISLGPLLTFNVILLFTLGFFSVTYKNQPKTEDVDLKVHSAFLPPFLKEYWYWLTSPFVKLMVKLHVTPNVMTVWGFVVCAISAYFFYKGMVGAGGWFMIFGASFDMFDGRIARMTGKASKSGAFFDSVMDRFSEAVVFLGLASYYRSTWVLYFVVLALVGSLMVSYTRARGEGVGVDAKHGIMQRPERIVYLGVGSIFSPVVAHFVSSLVPVPLDFMTIGAILLIAALTNVAALTRMRYVIPRLDPTDTAPRHPSRFLSRLIHRWNNLGS